MYRCAYVPGPRNAEPMGLHMQDFNSFRKEEVQAPPGLESLMAPPGLGKTSKDVKDFAASVPAKISSDGTMDASDVEESEDTRVGSEVGDSSTSHEPSVADTNDQTHFSADTIGFSPWIPDGSSVNTDASAAFMEGMAYGLHCAAQVQGQNFFPAQTLDGFVHPYIPHQEGCKTKLSAKAVPFVGWSTCPDPAMALEPLAPAAFTSAIREDEPLMVPPPEESLHARGECKPCAYYFGKQDGCRWGDDCEFCHLCPPDEIKKRKKEKAKAMRELEKQEGNGKEKNPIWFVKRRQQKKDARAKAAAAGN